MFASPKKTGLRITEMVNSYNKNKPKNKQTSGRKVSTVVPWC